MIVRFLAIPARNRIFGCFQLDNHAGKTLCERVVNVARHSIAFFEDRRAPTLLGKLIELKREHDLMGERLGQFNLLRPIRGLVAVADSDKSPNLATNQKWNSEKSLRSFFLQIVAPLGSNTRISLHIVANDWPPCEKQFLDNWVLFPKRWVLHKWMRRVGRRQFSAVRH